MGYKVSAADLRHIRLSEADTVAAILQNVAVILATRQGSSPLYRHFGLPQNFLDKPIPVAKPMLFAEVKEAVEGRSRGDLLFGGLGLPGHFNSDSGGGNP